MQRVIFNFHYTKVDEMSQAPISRLDDQTLFALTKTLTSTYLELDYRYMPYIKKNEPVQ